MYECSKEGGASLEEQALVMWVVVVGRVVVGPA